MNNEINNENNFKGCGTGSNQPQRFSKEFVIETIENVGDYEIVDKEKFIYKRKTDKILIRHISKNHTFLMSFENFKKGCRCSECSHNKQLTDKDVNDYLEKNNLNDKIIKLSEYVSTNSKIKFKCRRCEIEFERSFNNIKNAKLLCPICDSLIRRNITYNGIDCFLRVYKDGEFSRVITDNSPNLNETYDSSDTFNIKHNKCGHIFKTDMKSLHRNRLCPECLSKSKDSEGIKIIKEFLNSKNIIYETEKYIDGCIYKKEMLFDIFIPEKNLAIEFDGMQHFFKKFLMGDEDMRTVKNRDHQKNKFCIKNNINLLRIPSTKTSSIKKIMREIYSCNFTNLENSTTIHNYSLYYNLVNNKDYYLNINSKYFDDFNMEYTQASGNGQHDCEDIV